MLWRQGDVFVESFSGLPEFARQAPLPHGTLVHGEATGHKHRVEDLEAAKVYAGAVPGELFLEVTGNVVRIVHEEHGPLEIPKGTYRIWRQREYSPEAIRTVID
jgi:hypothetical protein